MNQFIFSGSGVALVTPFKDGEIDFESLENLIGWVTGQGVDFLVCLGTTGEAITLTKKECEEVKNTFVRVNNGKLPIVYGIFGSNNTRELTEKLNTYDLKGVDGLLSSSPNYNKPTQEGIFQHYKQVADNTKLPVIIYNVPSRTASNMEADTIVKLANYSDKFVAVKEASGDLAQVSKIMKEKPQRFNVLSGDDPLTLPIMALGGNGCISVIGNAYPKEWSDLIHYCMDGNYEKARAINNSLLDLHPHIYCEGNPVGIKAVMESKNLCSREVRLPLVPFTEGRLSGLQVELDKCESDLLKMLDSVAKD